MGIVRAQMAVDTFFECPRHLSIATTEEERVGLGTLIEKAVGLIPFVKNLPCYGPDGKLIPTSGCGKRRAFLDSLTTPKQ